VVVGLANSGDGSGIHRGYRWTGAGMMELDMLPGGYASTARGVSADGTAVAGWTGFQSYSHATRWTTTAGLTDLGLFPTGLTSYGYDMSDDGAVVVGYGSVNGSYTIMHAFRWTASGGMTDLGTLSTGGMYSYGYGVSGNGLVVVGTAQKNQTGLFVAFRWTAGTGMVNLGTLKPNLSAEAWGANTDGSVVVGNSGTANGDRAFRWTNGRMTDLGTLSGLPNSYGLAVSGNGSTVVGYCGGANGDPTNRAFLWTSAGGMRNLNTYLPTLGFDLTGWTLNQANRITADGQTIVGSGLHNGELEAWIVHLQ
jgi:probable HAF family extracellular repeat protein